MARHKTVRRRTSWHSQADRPFWTKTRFEVLEDRCLLTGVTLITHGYESVFSTYPGWVDSMAAQVADRIAAVNHGAASQVAEFKMTIGYTLGGRAVTGWDFDEKNFKPDPDRCYDPKSFDLKNSLGGEAIICLDWSALASFPAENASTVAQLVADYLSSPDLGTLGLELLGSPIHLIGHDSGGVVVSDLAKDLGQQGLWVDQVTTLDANPPSSILAWSNVAFWDNYWQSRYKPSGAAIPGTSSNHGAQSGDGMVFPAEGYTSPIEGGHSNIHLWYQGTIDTTHDWITDGTGDATVGFYAAGASDDHWYGGANPPRTTSGYAFSRIARSVQPIERASEGVSTSLDGHGPSAVVPSSPGPTPWPNIITLATASQDVHVAVNGQFHVSYWRENDCSSAHTQFFLDPDQNAFNGNEILIGDGSESQTARSPASRECDLNIHNTSVVAGRKYYLYAVIDDGRMRYCYASGTVTIDPTLTAGDLTPPSAVEGVPFSNATILHFSDSNVSATAATFTAQVTLGNGTTVDTSSANVQIAAAGDGFDVRLSYTYADELAGGTFSVSVTDGATTVSRSIDTFSVADAGLTATAASVAAMIGVPFNGTVATFSDANPAGAAGDYAATIDWGDGSATPTARIFVDHDLPLPVGLAFDTQGNLYVSCQGDYRIRKVTPSGAVSIFSTDIGWPALMDFHNGNLYVAGYADNRVVQVAPDGTASTFVSGLTNPGGVAFDKDGNLYVTNINLNTISKVTPGGSISTFVDSTKGLNAPIGLAFDTNRNLLYVANEEAGTVSTVTLDGVVTTFASGFLGPFGLTLDASGNLYVANWDHGGNSISQVTPAGIVRQYVGGLAWWPCGLAFDSSGNLFVSTWLGNTIAKIAPPVAPGDCTISALPGGGFAVQGSHTYAAQGAYSVTVVIADKDGGATATAQSTINVSNSVLTAGTFTPPVATEGVPFSNVTVYHFCDSNPAATPATFTALVTLGDGHSVTLTGTHGANGQIVAGSDGFDVQLSYTYVALLTAQTFSVQITADDGAATVSQSTGAFSVADAPLAATAVTLTAVTGVPVTGTVATFADANPAGAAGDYAATIDWGDRAIPPVVSTFVSNSSLDRSTGIAFDRQGNLFVANAGNNTISKVTPAGELSTFAHDRLLAPQALAVDKYGNVYAANVDSTITKVTPTGEASIFVSSGLSTPIALAFSASGNLFVSNAGNNTICVVTPAGVVTSFVDLPPGRLYPSEGLAFDDRGNLYVANRGNTPLSRTIDRFTPAGADSVFVENAPGFSEVQFLAFDRSGNLYVANGGNDTISKVTPARVVTTFANSGLNNPEGLAFDTSDNLYVANYAGNYLSQITQSLAPDPVTISVLPGGGFAVQGSHTYATQGSYSVTVVVTDKDGGATATAQSTVNVSNPVLTAGAFTPPVATEGVPFSNVPILHFSDSNPAATPADFTASVTLGDGNSVTLTDAHGANGQIVAGGDGFDVQLSYTYTVALTGQTFSVLVTAGAGTTTSASTTNFSVAGSAPTTLIKSLDFNVDGVLPSAEPDIDYAPNPFGIAEQSVYSVHNGWLHQDTMGLIGWTNYESLHNQFSHADAITMEARLRINRIEATPFPGQYEGGGAYFGVYDGAYEYQLLFDENGVFSGTATGIDRVPFNTSGFHTYRLTTPGNSNRYDLFIDGQHVRTWFAGSYYLNGYAWGDGRSTFGNGANVDWDYLRVWRGASSPRPLWTGNAGTSWNDPGNWDGGVVPNANDDVSLSATTPGNQVATLGGDQAAMSLAFNANASTSITIAAGNTLTLGSGGITLDADTAASHAINADIALAAAQTWTIGGDRSLHIGGSVRGTGGLTKSGTGTLVLSGANTFSGGTTVASGTLIVTNSTALPNGSALTVGAGGTLVFDPTVTAALVASPATSTNFVSVSTPGNTMHGTSFAVQDGTSSVVSTAAATAATVPVRPQPSAAPASLNAVVGAGRFILGATLDLAVKEKWATAAAQIAIIRDAAIQAAISPRYAGNLAWLEDSWKAFSSSAQDDKKTRFIQALDAVLAQYGQQ